jgi:dTDP-4-dehydrorhamnose 3,5-epimerase
VIFRPAGIEGTFVIELEPHSDDRGFFARTFCEDEFREHGVETAFVQANVSFNVVKGIIRGFHYQVAPALEPKLFRCTRGATYNVAVDMRAESVTYGRHAAVELSEENRLGFYVPALCATAYQALTDGAEVHYLVGRRYTPECERGIRYDDPALGVEWPLPPVRLTEKDTSWPLLEGFPEAVSR